MPNIENTVQQRLGIKWVDAKRLVLDATRNCEINDCSIIPADRNEEVIEEACEIFNDLDEAEQARMRKSLADEDSAAAAAATITTREEPAWKRKAREHAERREAAWRAKDVADANTEKVRERLREAGVPEEEVQSTKVTSIRLVEAQPRQEKRAGVTESTTGKGTVRIRTHTCICVIL